MRVGLAGYAVGRNIHAPMIEEAGGEVVAVATSNPQRIAQLAAERPHARRVSDLTELLTLEGLDLIVLTTPTGAHLEHSLQVIEAGFPFVIDKPLAVDAAQCRQVVTAAEQAGVPMSVFQNRRWDDDHRTLKKLATDGTLGDIWRNEYRWERWRPDPPRRWRETAPPAEGGGLLLDLHAHLIDSAIDLLGEVADVFAEVDARLSLAEDDVFVALHHVNGAISHLWSSSDCAAPGPRRRVLGSKGAFVLNEFHLVGNNYPDLANASPDHSGWLVRDTEREPVPTAPGAPADYYRTVFAALASNDRQAGMPVDPRDAVRIAEIIDAARVSAQEHRCVKV